MVDVGVVCLKGLLAVFYIFQGGGAEDENWKKYSSVALVGYKWILFGTMYFGFEIF